MNLLKLSLVLILVITATGCATGPPSGMEPVSGFEADRYLGQWYEIARLDHRFERNMTDVTATYSYTDNGDIRVVNRGYDTKKEEWRSAEGKAKFRGAEDVGSLKVSFFGPFYGGYHIIDLDDEYQYALVAGPSLSYLWILARDSKLDESVAESLVAKAKALGFATDELIWVTHDREDVERGS